MSGTENFADTVATWAQHEPSVEALVLIGSRTRPPADTLWRADAFSDWDFQVVTSKPQMFSDTSWTHGLEGTEVRAYAHREARLGDVPKISVVFKGAEADFILLPAPRLKQLRQATLLGQHREPGEVRRNLQSLAIVLRPGWLFLKGAETWEPFYRSVLKEVPDPRLDDAMVRTISDGFVCDYVSARRKLERGELLTVQRMLHRDLAEVNFRLMHELKLRRGERSFPEARRIERVATPGEISSLCVNALPNAGLLHAAIEQSAATLRALVDALAGGTWRWPIL